VAITDSPRPRRYVLAPFQRLRRRPTSTDDSKNKHGGLVGHVTNTVLPVIVERSSAECHQDGGQNGRRPETLLDAMHKKYYPDQYGVATAGSDVRTSDDVILPGGGKDESAVCRSAATTSAIIGDSPEGATGRSSSQHVTGSSHEILNDRIIVELLRLVVGARRTAMSASVCL